MSGFEVFSRPQHRGRVPISTPTIRVDAERGTVHVRAVALRAFGDAQRIAFVYDLDSLRWGLKPEAVGGAHAYRLHRTGKSSAFVQASAFVRWWGASGEYQLVRQPARDGMIVAERITAGGVLVHPFWEAVR